MSALETPRTIAIRALTKAQVDWTDADGAVDVVLDALAEPDRDMLAAGLTELNLALAKDQHPTGTRDRKALLRVIWAAMLDRAR
jgi:hypothetical protein